MFAGKKSAQIREILISESAWEEMTCLFAPSLVAELLCVKEITLEQLVSDRIAAYPASGEINIKLENPELAINSVRAIYGSDALVIDETDGISLEFSNWRFNLRSSNTEPVVRLNVESRSDVELMKNKTDEILNLLKSK